MTIDGRILDALSAAQAGIFDALVLEDGLDGKAGEYILEKIHEAMRVAGREDLIQRRVTSDSDIQK
jgi:hypothetical protein